MGGAGTCGNSEPTIRAGTDARPAFTDKAVGMRIRQTEQLVHAAVLRLTPVRPV